MARSKTRKSKGKRQRDTRLKRFRLEILSQDLTGYFGHFWLGLGYVRWFVLQVDGKNGIEHVVGLSVRMIHPPVSMPMANN